MDSSQQDEQKILSILYVSNQNFQSYWRQKCKKVQKSTYFAHLTPTTLNSQKRGKSGEIISLEESCVQQN